MTLEDLAQKTDRIIEATPALWAWAELLGEARTRSNDGRRDARSSRGAGNRQVDLMGAFSELLLLAWVRRLTPTSDSARMAAHLYHRGGGREVVGADLHLPTANGAMAGIDAKSFDCAPSKHYFAINEDKHRALGSECSWYFCVLAAPYGRQAAVARLVPYEDVGQWQRGHLRPGGSPSRHLDIGLFLGRYFSAPPSLSALRKDTFPAHEIQARKVDPSCRERLLQLIPHLPI